MCAVSMAGDYWRDQLPQKPYYPGIQPFIHPSGGAVSGLPPLMHQVTKAEFDALKRDVEELKKLLTAAKKYDEAVGEPDCEVEDKVELIKKVAKLVGVSMDDIFGKGAS
jgi:hypothetical protein